MQFITTISSRTNRTRSRSKKKSYIGSNYDLLHHQSRKSTSLTSSSSGTKSRCSTKMAGGKASSWRSSLPGSSLSSSGAPRSKSCLGRRSLRCSGIRTKKIRWYSKPRKFKFNDI
ncbi:hypothetical protein LINPERPRIM_LOCUS6801 [Linum perenne]